MDNKNIRIEVIGHQWLYNQSRQDYIDDRDKLEMYCMNKYTSGNGVN